MVAKPLDVAVNVVGGNIGSGGEDTCGGGGGGDAVDLGEGGADGGARGRGGAVCGRLRKWRICMSSALCCTDGCSPRTVIAPQEAVMSFDEEPECVFASHVHVRLLAVRK